MQAFEYSFFIAALKASLYAATGMCVKSGFLPLHNRHRPHLRFRRHFTRRTVLPVERLQRFKKRYLRCACRGGYYWQYRKAKRFDQRRRGFLLLGLQTSILLYQKEFLFSRIICLTFFEPRV